MIESPSRVEAVGTRPEPIHEFVGPGDPDEGRGSVARMRSPEGRLEPGRRAALDEYTVVIYDERFRPPAGLAPSRRRRSPRRRAPRRPHRPGAPAPVPPVPPGTDAGLRRDIRTLGTLLGETLVRQEGLELLELVEQVRTLMRSDRDAAAGVLALLDTVDATRLVRAFTTWFYLVNVAEQAHRSRELAGIRLEHGTWLQQAIDRIAAAGHMPGEVAADLRHVCLRPVFTAHPTEAARRTVLTKMRRIATLLDEWERALGADGHPRDPVAERRVRRRLEEVIDLLWQTDELRVVRPEPIDEARNAAYYFDALHRDAVPHTLESLGEELARIGVDLPVDARPLTFGTWIGGDRDGNPNVTPQATLDVLALQHEHGIRDAL